MKKKICELFAVCMVLGLTGCTQHNPINTEPVEDVESSASEPETGNGAGSTVVDLTSRSRQTIDLSTFEEVDTGITVKEIVIELEEHESVTSYVIEDGMLYYLTSYYDYYQRFLETGTEVLEYDKNHTSKLRSYNLETGEKIVLHEFLMEFVLLTADLSYEDGMLTWQEWLYKDGTYEWSCRRYNLAEHMISESLGPSKGNDVIYEIDGGEVFNASSNTNIKYMFGSRFTQIEVEQDGRITRMGVTGKVDYINSNGEICVWRYPGSVDNLHVYDIINDQYISMGMGFMSMMNVCIYKQWMLVDTESGIYAYNIPQKQYIKLGDVDAGYFFVNAEYIYTEVIDNDDSVFSLLHIY